MVYIGAALIGLLLGLMGSGGSILTVPVLYYLVGHQGTVAIAESMAIVGLISVFAVAPAAWRGNVCWITVIRFGLPGVVGTYLGAMLGLYTGPQWPLVVFSVVLLAAAWIMFRPAPKGQATETTEPTSQRLLETLLSPKTPKIILEGLVVGAVTGFVGVGGGFLIVPALVSLGGLSMRRAVATSLVVIFLKSLIGFWKYQHGLSESGQTVDWNTILIFAAVGVAGSFVGQQIGQRMKQERLRFAFAVFLLIMGAFVMSQEVPKLWKTPAAQETAAAIKADQVSYRLPPLPDQTVALESL